MSANGDSSDVAESETVPIETHSAVSLQIDCLQEKSHSQELPLSKILLEDLGFAKQSGYEWHPALKRGEIARGSRIKVTFFGTGDSCFVNKADWIQYSEETKLKVIIFIRKLYMIGFHHI